MTSRNEEIAAQLDQVDGPLAYRLFCERSPQFVVIFQMHAAMIKGGRAPEEIVDTIIGGLSDDMRQWAADHPHVRTLMIRAATHAATLPPPNPLLN